MLDFCKPKYEHKLSLGLPSDRQHNHPASAADHGMDHTQGHQEKVVSYFSWPIRISHEVHGIISIEVSCCLIEPSGKGMAVQTVDFSCTQQRAERRRCCALVLCTYQVLSSRLGFPPALQVPKAMPRNTKLKDMRERDINNFPWVEHLLV